jgi:hypothetical protein
VKKFLQFGTRLRQQLIYLSAEIREAQDFAPNVEEAVLSFARAVLAEGGRILLTTSDLELVDLMALTAGEYQQSEPTEEEESMVLTETRKALSLPQAAPIVFLPTNEATEARFREATELFERTGLLQFAGSKQRELLLRQSVAMVCIGPVGRYARDASQIFLSREQPVYALQSSGAKVSGDAVHNFEDRAKDAEKALREWRRELREFPSEQEPRREAAPAYPLYLGPELPRTSYPLLMQLLVQEISQLPDATAHAESVSRRT